MSNLSRALGLTMAVSLTLISFLSIAEESSLARVYTLQVSYDQQPDFEKAFKDHIAWRKKAEDPWQWMAYQVIDGEGIGNYIVRSGNHKWADFSASDEFGKKSAKQWREGPAKYVARVSSHTTTTWQDTINWPEENFDPQFFQINEYRVKIGKMEQLHQAAREMHKAIMEHKWPVNYAFVQIDSGGPANQVTLVLPYLSWSAMEQPEVKLQEVLVKTYGEEKAADILGRWSDAVLEINTFMLRKRGDLVE
ncbi:hypothetical protein [Paraferrimonas haliotis]|uniref:NIPSNAP domain-containing protein n=1 Tax=Paraferrimonas haliotis TaxID=2013866 RepID=A0AA37TT60_9GAMM|nr:hypothetical protein [Paraferrimonas haliotis]GLS85020.1 hypothetical protein GCM10007894_29970 [Paraferrimonas haliotis]